MAVTTGRDAPRTALLIFAVSVTLSGSANTDVNMAGDDEQPPTPPTEETPPTPAAEETPRTPTTDMPTADEPPPPEQPEETADRMVITGDDDGALVRLPVDGYAELRLDGEALWDEPQVEGDAIELVAIQYFQDPGYQAWEIHAQRPGSATVRSTTLADEGQQQRAFEVTIDVTEG